MPVSGRRKLRWGLAQGPVLIQSAAYRLCSVCGKSGKLQSWDVGLDLSREFGQAV